MPWVFRDFSLKRYLCLCPPQLSSVATALQLPMTGGCCRVLCVSQYYLHGRDQNFVIARICATHGVIAYFDCHVTNVLESDWRALYSARRHGPYTHLTRPLLAFCVRGGWLARVGDALLIFSVKFELERVGMRGWGGGGV